MVSSNFSFLEANWQDLSQLGKLAESNLYDDPNTTIIKLRIFGEKMVDHIFGYHKLEEPTENTQFNRLKLLEEKELADEEILAHFHLLRKKGNQAVHEVINSGKEARELLKEAYQLALWFMKNYGEANFKCPEFRMPKKDNLNKSYVFDNRRKFITTNPLDSREGAAEEKIWDAVRNSLRDNECVAYWRYPIFSQQGAQRKEPDILIVDRELGLIVIEVNKIELEQIVNIHHDTWEYKDYRLDSETPVLDAEDQIFALQGYLSSERKLRGKVNCRSLVALPNIKQEEWAERGLSKQITRDIIFEDQLGRKSLLQEIKDNNPVISARRLTAAEKLKQQEWNLLLSVLTGTAIYRDQEEKESQDLTTRLGVKSVIKEQIYKVDLQQEEIGKCIPPGPQRIRGIAGSGKSVLLAQKAAHMHLKNPELKIVLVFFTRSLYDAMIEQVDNWLKRFTNGKVGYDPAQNQNLQILHAWGSRNQAGFYRKICEQHGYSPLTVSNLSEDTPAEKLIEACKLFLQATDQIKPTFDAVLIDEAQDLVVDDNNLKYKSKQPFFWLAYQSLRPVDEDGAKRLIWAYDEAQSLNALNIPTAPELFGNDPRFKSMVSGFHEGGIRKSEIMSKCYRTPGPILVAAHAIGMGLLRQQGMLRGLTTKKDWENIGYQVQSGTFRPGNQIVLHRSSETTPNSVPELWSGDVIKFNKFSTRREELKDLAHKIKYNIHKDGLDPSRDILVISVGYPREASRLKAKVAKFLINQGIDVYIPTALKENVIYPKYPKQDANKFWHQGAVTISNIFRAKGNEAYITYVVGLDQIAESEADISLRNQLFVALTRTKGWCQISGTGKYELYQELENVLASGNTFKFEFQRPAVENRESNTKNNNDVTTSNSSKSKEELEQLITEIIRTSPQNSTDISVDSLYQLTAYNITNLFHLIYILLGQIDYLTKNDLLQLAYYYGFNNSTRQKINAILYNNKNLFGYRTFSNLDAPNCQYWYMR